MARKRHTPEQIIHLLRQAEIELASGPRGHVWSYDFMAARTTDGRAVRLLTVIDEFTRGCLAIDVTRTLTADHVLDRLAGHYLDGVPKADVRADPRRPRRALTEEELTRLLAVAASRPLLDARTIRRGKRKGKASAALTPARTARLQGLGRERALMYKALVLTGLRENELRTLTVGQLDLTAGSAYLQQDAADEKSGEGNALAVRDDLAADLRAWLADKLAVLQEAARAAGEPVPARLPGDMPIFMVPSSLRMVMDRDLRAAGIPKRDDRGRTVDVHALRTTFCTLLSKGGVAPRTAQAAMRHSDIKLTMGVYTDPRLLDVRAAVEKLPALGLPAGEQSSVAPVVTPTPGYGGTRRPLLTRLRPETKGRKGAVGST